MVRTRGGVKVLTYRIDAEFLEIHEQREERAEATNTCVSPGIFYVAVHEAHLEQILNDGYSAQRRNYIPAMRSFVEAIRVFRTKHPGKVAAVLRVSDLPPTISIVQKNRGVKISARFLEPCYFEHVSLDQENIHPNPREAPPGAPTAEIAGEPTDGGGAVAAIPRDMQVLTDIDREIDVPPINVEDLEGTQGQNNVDVNDNIPRAEHVDLAAQAIQAELSTPTCCHYLRNCCRFESNCRFSHEGRPGVHCSYGANCRFGHFSSHDQVSDMTETPQSAIASEPLAIVPMPVLGGRRASLLLHTDEGRSGLELTAAYIVCGTQRGYNALFRISDRDKQTSQLLRLGDKRIRSFQTGLEPAEVEHFRASEIRRLQSALVGGRLLEPSPIIEQCHGHVVCESHWVLEITLLDQTVTSPVARYHLEQGVEQLFKPVSRDEHPRPSRAQTESASGLVRCFGSFCCTHGHKWKSSTIWAKVTGDTIHDPDQSGSRFAKHHHLLPPKQYCQQCNQAVRASSVEAFEPDNPRHRVGGLHNPSSCPVCISTGHWCIDAAKPPSFYDSAAMKIARQNEYQTRWNKCDAGVEMRIPIQGKEFLIQLRPNLFCLDRRYVEMTCSKNDSGAELFRKNFPAGLGRLKNLLVAFHALLHRKAKRMEISMGDCICSASDLQVRAHELTGELADFFIEDWKKEYRIDARSPTVIQNIDGGLRRFAVGSTWEPSWELAYHGTSADCAASILMDGLLQKPGVGNARIAHGQANSKSKKTIYVSPSLCYAMHPVYSTVFEIGPEHYAQIVFEVRVRPGAKKIQSRTLKNSHFDKQLQFDPDFPDGLGLEWLLESSADVVLTALVVREMGSKCDQAVFGELCSKVRAVSELTQSRDPATLAGFCWSALVQEERRRCGLFALRRRGALLVCRSNCSEVLLVELRSASLGVWVLPGGSVNFAKDGQGDNGDLKCALREFEEETGISRAAVTVVEGWKFEGVDTTKRTRTMYRLAYFHGTDTSRSHPSAEIRQQRWFSLDDALRMAVFSSDQAAIQEVVARSSELRHR
eukprot:TRINITY_DN54909_c0_g1_i1.p1 TRINITY_DN54909_c0_g1~~TRINITY_DN54909_c0_g1_i1.p1  ORF type:complete len:1043 (-),score=83.23 TRINITY_DN54909_c0_g1_i1:6-3134(-)